MSHQIPSCALQTRQCFAFEQATHANTHIHTRAHTHTPSHTSVRESTHWTVRNEKKMQKMKMKEHDFKQRACVETHTTAWFQMRLNYSNNLWNSIFLRCNTQRYKRTHMRTRWVTWECACMYKRIRLFAQSRHSQPSHTSTNAVPLNKQRARAHRHTHARARPHTHKCSWVDNTRPQNDRWNIMISSNVHMWRRTQLYDFKWHQSSVITYGIQFSCKAIQVTRVHERSRARTSARVNARADVSNHQQTWRYQT